MASKVLLVAGALAAVTWPADVASQGFTATVLSIGDGDTIRVSQAGKALTVRLASIDSPDPSSADPRPALIGLKPAASPGPAGAAGDRTPRR